MATEASLAALAEAPAVIAVDVGGRSIKRSLVAAAAAPLTSQRTARLHVNAAAPFGPRAASVAEGGYE